MAKKKKEDQPVTNSVVQNWAEQNSVRLSEISSENPVLYKGIVQALNYLNQSLGGTGTVTPVELPSQKETTYETEKTEEQVGQKIWTKEDFIDSVVIVDTNAEARAYQKLVLGLGFTWKGGEKTVFKTYARSFLIDSEDQYIQASKIVPSKYQLNMWNVKVLNFRDLGIEPIPDIISAYEILDSSILVENVEQFTFLTEKLAKGFNIRFDSDTTPYVDSYPRYFNITSYKNKEGKFTISAQPSRPIDYSVEEFGYPYKTTYEKGDRYIFKTVNSYIYSKKENGQINYEIDFSSSRSLISRWVSSVAETTDVLWTEDKAFNESQLVKGITDGSILILKLPPKYREGQEFGNVKIMAIGYDQNTHNYKYQIYLKKEKEFRRFDSEQDLATFLEISSMVDWLDENTEESTKLQHEFSVGDKVKIPKTKRGKILQPQMSIVVDIADGLGQDYLYVTEIDGDILVLDTTKSDTGDFFSIKNDNIELYIEPKQKKPQQKFEVGDNVIFKGGSLTLTVKEVVWQPAANSYEYKLVWDLDGQEITEWDTNLEFAPVKEVKPEPKFKKGDNVTYRGSQMTWTIEGIKWNDYFKEFSYDLWRDDDGKTTIELESKLEPWQPAQKPDNNMDDDDLESALEDLEI